MAFGQVTSDTQSFTVVVDNVLSVAFGDDVQITHDGTDNNQVFSAQSCSVRNNNGAGAVVTFTGTPFVLSGGSVKRNARLNLAVASADSGSGWTATVNQFDSVITADPLPDVPAVVEATSTGPGDGALSLTTTFLETDFSTLPTGSYVATVTCTITIP